MYALWHDLRFAVHGLGRSPGFTAVVALTLALGIGATTGVFSAVHAVLLASMPFPESDRLVLARATFKGSPTGFSGPDCIDYMEQATSFSSFAAQLERTVPMPFTGRERPVNVRTTFVSVGLFPTLGVAPALGRPFFAEEGKPAPVTAFNQPTPIPSVAIVSHAFWQQRLGGASGVVGSSMTLMGQPVTVVGVMPEGFRFVHDVDVWFPLQLNGPFAEQRRFHNWFMVGRLKPGVTVGEAQAEVSTIAARLEKLYPDSNTGMGIRLEDLHRALAQFVRPALLLVMVAVALMLLIACGNVTSLMLARAVTRRSELALRVALGASRGRLATQLVTESVVLALLGGALGLGVASGLQRVLPLLLRLSRNQTSADAFHLDARVLAFAFVVSLITGVVVGLYPALRSASLAPFEELKGGARTVTSSGGARVRLALVAVQVALSFVLLLGSALLVRSFAKLMGVELGFAPESLLTSELSLPGTVTDGEAIQFFTAVLDEVRAVPGVVAAGVTSRLPILQPGGSVQVWTPEHPERHAFNQQALGREVLPGYLDAMRMPLLAGRDLAMTDRTGTPPVMVISQAMAHRLFEADNPVGRHVLADLGDAQPTDFEVVGLVADARLNRLSDDPPSVMYLSLLQYTPRTMRLVLRSTADPQAVVSALRALVARHRSDVPVGEPATMQRIIRDSTLAQRALVGILTSFSIFAVLLAAIGLYGVLAYQVGQRRHEIGLRMALGALRRHVLATALRQGLLATGIGLAVGTAAALALARLLSGLLYGVAPADPLSVAGAVACLLVVALAACLLPAIQAVRVEPMTALRFE